MYKNIPGGNRSRVTPTPLYGQNSNFWQKGRRDSIFYQNDRIWILKTFPSARGHFALKRFLNGLIGQLVKIRKNGPRNF